MQARTQPRTQGSTRVYIRDHLGADQVSEDVRILIDSREAGRFSLDEQHPASVIPVVVSTPGQHSYTVEVSAMLRRGRGQPERREYVGQGTFIAAPDKVFRLAADRTGNGWMVHLETDMDEQEVDE
jgi:hypothetical protein